jgi:hypothetical protein
MLSKEKVEELKQALEGMQENVNQMQLEVIALETRAKNAAPAPRTIQKISMVTDYLVESFRMVLEELEALTSNEKLSGAKSKNDSPEEKRTSADSS